MSLKHFGTDGIRGTYGTATLGDDIAFRAGRAAARVVKDLLGKPAPTFVVGRDTRASGRALLAAFLQGATSEGASILDLGIAPTPCVAFAAARSHADLGCSITASHNPASDNGLKFFSGDGSKPSVELEQALDDAVAAASASDRDPASPFEETDGSLWTKRYLDAAVAFFPSLALEGLRVALDCANGAVSALAPRAFEALGAKVVAIGAEPDGSNINAGVGSEHPEALQAELAAGGYDCGFAFDGDGDRVALFDERGRRVSGEAVLAVLALDAQRRGALTGGALVTTVQSNLGLDLALRARGIETKRVDVGDKHIARLMRECGYALGGEESGHLVIGDFAITGDGLVAALLLARIVRESAEPASALASVFQPFPQRSEAVRVAEKRPLDRCGSLSKCIRSLATELGARGRLLVRYSGTEPKLRLLVEAQDERTVAAAMESLLAAAALDLEIV